MKVSELIAELQNFHPDLDVVVEPCEPQCLGEAVIESVLIDVIGGVTVAQLSRASVRDEINP